MKPMQIMFDEALLARRQQQIIAEQYREAYAAEPDGGEELAGWGEEGSCRRPPPAPAGSRIS